MFLEDGRHFVYFANTADRRNSRSYLGDLGNGSTVLVVGRDVATVPAGDRLLFAQDRTLITQRFDAARGEFHDSAQAIAGAVDVGGPRMSGPSFAASTQVLIYRNSRPPISRLVWFDRRGAVGGEVSTPAEYEAPALSPDGRRIAVARADDRTNGSNLWLLDVERNLSMRLTFGPQQDASPLWSPEGDRIAYASRRDGLMRLMTTSVAGGGVEQEIAASPQMVSVSDWSIDGRTLLYTTQDPKTGLDIWAIPLTGDRKPWALIQTPFNESDARLSPDGRWVAYVSNESGIDQVYVRSFPKAESKWQISANGGTHPHWSRDGRELLFVAAGDMLASVRVDSEPAFRVSEAVQISRLPGATGFELTPDGQRVLVQMPEDGANANELHVIVNWRSELK
jgi:serine/threonine-protein kinase